MQLLNYQQVRDFVFILFVVKEGGENVEWMKSVSFAKSWGTGFSSYVTYSIYGLNYLVHIET